MKIDVPTSTAMQVKKLARVRGTSMQDAADFFLRQALTADAPLVPRPEEGASDDPPYRISITDPQSGITEQEASALIAAAASRLPHKVRNSDRPVSVPYEFDIRERDGRITKGHRSFVDHNAPTTRDHAAYEYLKDLQPDYYTPFHQLLHARFTQRYEKYVRNPERWFIPRDGRVAVDAGAYIGYKAVALHDVMGPESTVVAIEMMLANYLLMEQNIRINNLRDRIHPHPYPLSSERHRQFVASIRDEGSYANTLAELDSFADQDRSAIDAFPLSDILDMHDFDTVDYLNIQVNGSELPVLIGLHDWFPRVRRFFIACPYQGMGVAGQDDIRSYLLAKGTTIIHDKPGLLVADNP